MEEKKGGRKENRSASLGDLTVSDSRSSVVPADPWKRNHRTNSKKQIYRRGKRQEFVAFSPRRNTRSSGGIVTAVRRTRLSF